MRLDRSRLACRARWASTLTLLCAAVSIAQAVPEDEPSQASPRPKRPDLTDPVVCVTIRGFRDIVERDEPTLTRDEKLQIYFEPFNYLIVRDVENGRYRAHLTESVRIRRAGDDRVLQAMDAVVDYAPEADSPPSATFLGTTLSLKEFPPGSYEVDLILRDELAEDPAETVRTIAFRVVSEADARPAGRSTFDPASPK